MDNGPCYGKSIASSNKFCVYIGSAANRLEFFEFGDKNIRSLYAADAVVTDMTFMPATENMLITASRDRFVSENYRNNDMQFCRINRFRIQFKPLFSSTLNICNNILCRKNVLENMNFIKNDFNLYIHLSG